VVRGGAFNNNERNVRCAYRNGNNPNNQNRNQGLRLVVATLFHPAGIARRLRLPGRGVKNGGACPWPCSRRKAWSRANSNRPAPWEHPTLCRGAGTVPGAGHPSTEYMVYTQVCSWDNLLLAYRRASKGKRGQPNVAAFEHRLEDNLLELQQELREKTYRPGSYVSFTIHEPKRRLISAAPFGDRVVHHALCNVIEPIFERRFIHDSYANRVGKGTHRALDRCQAFARRYRYVLQCDVRQYFPSIDHAILRDILGQIIEDPDVMWLIDRILESGIGVLSEAYQMVWFPGDDLFAANRPRGLPIGNLTSQFWANCYLNPFDHFIKRELRCQGYLRYVDDTLLFADDKATLWEWHEAVVRRSARLRLTIHPGAHPQPVTEGIPFLGFLVFPTHRRLKRRKGIAYQRRLKDLLDAYAAGEIPLERVTASVQGWANHARYGNTVGLRTAILGSIVIPGTLIAG
jgi:RNA-directed DNA polymerase